MKSDQEEKETAKPEPQAADRKTGPGRYSWPLYAALLLVAAGIIVGLIFLARWIYHETNHPKTHLSSSQSQSHIGNKSSSSASGANRSTAKSGSSSSKHSSSKAKNGQVPNTGPGNVIGLFTLASLAAGGLHYVVSLRKAARES